MEGDRRTARSNFIASSSRYSRVCLARNSEKTSVMEFREINGSSDASAAPRRWPWYRIGLPTGRPKHFPTMKMHPLIRRCSKTSNAHVTRRALYRGRFATLHNSTLETFRRRAQAISFAFIFSFRVKRRCGGSTILQRRENNPSIRVVYGSVFGLLSAEVWLAKATSSLRDRFAL